MERLTSGSSLMIGSMPSGDADQAFQVLDRFPLDIPTWPQLPGRAFVEGMIPQCSGGFPGVRIDSGEKSIRLVRGDDYIESMTAAYQAVIDEDRGFFAISENFAEGLHRFLHRAAGAPLLPFAKGQMSGPFTFGLGLNDTDGKAAWWDEEYRDLIYSGLALKGAWQAEKLRETAESVLMFCDEPILSVLGTPAYMGVSDEDVIEGLNRVIDPIKASGALVGMHCCGNMDWGLAARTNLDILAFDAYEFGEKAVLYADSIAEFLKDDGWLAWGIVPTGDQAAVSRETVDSLLERLDRLTGFFDYAGIPEDLLRSRSLFTPSCGMGSLSEDSAVRVLDLLSGFTRALQEGWI